MARPRKVSGFPIKSLVVAGNDPLAGPPPHCGTAVNCDDCLLTGYLGVVLRTFHHPHHGPRPPNLGKSGTGQQQHYRISIAAPRKASASAQPWFRPILQLLFHLPLPFTLTHTHSISHSNLSHSFVSIPLLSTPRRLALNLKACLYHVLHASSDNKKQKPPAHTQTTPDPTDRRIESRLRLVLSAIAFTPGGKGTRD